MTPILVHIEPYDIAASARVDVRAASALEPDAFGLGDVPWRPALIERPQLSIEIMSPDLSGKVQAGKARFSISLENAQIAPDRKIKWGGSRVRIYSAKTVAWPAITEFDGEIVDHSFDIDSGLLTISAEVSGSLLEKPALTLEFDGSGGLGGEAEKRGTLKPAGFGSCENIPPVWFDTVRNIGMIDGYGNCTAITKLMEGASDMGTSVGNYANYAALAAAIDSDAVPPGRWATCIAEGLVGLGAPPVGVIGVNATFGSNRVGAIMQRLIQTHAGVAVGKLNTASFAALDAALNYPAHFWTGNQVEVKALLETLARSVNSTLLLTFQGEIAISRATVSAAVATLDRSGSTTPRCIDWKILAPMKPVWRIKARTARPAQVLSLEEVNYVDDIIDRGAYSGSTVYRAGNVVWSPDKSSWLYTNATAASGTAPPTWPTASNGSWQNLTPPSTAANITYADGTPIQALKPAELGANVTESRIAAGFLGAGTLATKNTVAWGADITGRPVIAERLFDMNYADTAAAAVDIEGANAAPCQMIVTTDTGGKALQVGDNDGNDWVELVWREWFSYSPTDLYEIIFDVEIFASGGPNATFYAGVAAQDKAGNNLGSGYNYINASALLQNPNQGRFQLKGYLKGYTTGYAAGLPNSPIAPVGLPDGTAAGFGQGAAVRFRPIALCNYVNASGRVVIHGVTVRRLAGAMAARTNVSLGDGYIRRADGSTSLTEALAITSLGTAAAFIGQAAWATYTGLVPGNVAGQVQSLTLGGNLTANAIYGPGTVWLNDRWPAELGANVTESRIAAGFVGAGTLATRNNVRLDHELVDESGNALPARYLRNNVNRSAALSTVAYPDGGFHTVDTIVTGAVQIILPPTIGTGLHTMVKFQVDVFDFVTGGTATYDISGYLFPTGPYWLQVVAKAVGAGAGLKPVRFGRTGSGGGDKFCVWIGDTGTVWNYPKVQVRNFMAGYTSTDVSYWQAGWGVSLVTAFPAVDHTVSTPTASDTVFGVNTLETWNGSLATLGNFKTALGNAASYTGQTDWGTYTGITTTNMAGRVSRLTSADGRATDGRLLNSSNNYGLRALNETPTFSQTNAGSSVTLDLGSNGKLYSDWGATITLPSATITGLAYSTKYYIWRNMPAPDGAGSSYGYSTTLNDALGVDKVYLGYFTTMSSGGSGGGGGGYGGGDCVAALANVLLEFGEIRPANQVVPGDLITALAPGLQSTGAALCQANHPAVSDCVTLTTASGISLTLAINTPMTLPGGFWEIAANMTGRPVAVMDCGEFRWEAVSTVAYAGPHQVAQITCENATFAAGDQPHRYIFSHNVIGKP